MTNVSAYTAANASVNGLNGRFARISVATGTQTDVRLDIYQSCAQLDSCQGCENQATAAASAACYSAGCACFKDE
eukprot:5814220-Prymnesium_polylepis.1